MMINRITLSITMVYYKIYQLSTVQHLNVYLISFLNFLPRFDLILLPLLLHCLKLPILLSPFFFLLCLSFAELPLDPQTKLISQKGSTKNDSHPNRNKEDISRHQEVTTSYLIIISLQSIEIIDEQDQDMNSMNDLSPGILESILKWLDSKDISQEDTPNQQQQDTTIPPLIQQGNEQPQSKPIHNRNTNIIRLQFTFLISLIPILPKLFLISKHHSTYQSHNNSK